VSTGFGLVLNELPFLAFDLLLASTSLAFGQGDRKGKVLAHFGG